MKHLPVALQLKRAEEGEPLTPKTEAGPSGLMSPVGDAMEGRWATRTTGTGRTAGVTSTAKAMAKGDKHALLDISTAVGVVTPTATFASPAAAKIAPEIQKGPATGHEVVREAKKFLKV